MNLRKFFAELKRRNVYKVAIAYGVVAWLLMQVASHIFRFFEIPNWAVRLVVLLALYHPISRSAAGLKWVLRGAGTKAIAVAAG